MARTEKARGYQKTFQDHTGKTAVMSWRGSEQQGMTLPPLMSWVFYMTSPNISPDNFNGYDFQRNFEQGELIDAVAWSRYEFFLLPGASPEECVAHFRGEMAARGTIWCQINKVDRATRKTLHTSAAAVEGPCTDDDEQSDNETPSGRLPGLIWLKKPSDLGKTHYRSWFFMYKYADGSAPVPDNREVSLVRFEPVWLAGHEDDDPTEQPISAKTLPIRWSAGDGATSFMVYVISSWWHTQVGEATSQALELEWDSW